MRRSSFLLLAAVMALSLTACVNGNTPAGSASLPPEDDAAASTSPAPEVSVPPEETMNPSKKVRFLADGNEIIVELEQNPAADALCELLPMELTFEDFNSVEKIAYPSEALNIEGAPDSCDPDVGDLCFYAPWGNLSFFYQDFRHSESLVPLGTTVSGLEYLERLDTVDSVTVEIIE